MKLLLVARSLDRGGAERQAVLLANGLHSCGHEVQVATFYPVVAPGPSLEDDLDDGVELLPLGKGSRWDLAQFVLRLVRLLRRERYHAVLTFLPVPNVVLSLARPFSRPRPLLLWGVRSSRLYFAQHDPHRWIYRLESALSSLPDRIIVNSRGGLGDAIASGFPPARTVVVQNGIDTDRFRPDAEARARTRAAWGVEADEIVIGSVGRLEPAKGTELFLEAAARLAAIDPRLRLVCVGAASEPVRQRYRDLASALGIGSRTIFEPPRPDATAVLNGFDIACSASLSEGFSNVVAEAMACGVACVASAVGDCADIVGEHGRTVPAGDATALADGIAQLLASDRAELGRAARARIVDRFSVARLVDETERVIADCDAV